MTVTTDSSVTAEVNSYLLDKSCELSSITTTRIYFKVSLRLTEHDIASQCSCRETLFAWRPSVHTLAFSTQSEHFEMMLFLRLAKW